MTIRNFIFEARYVIKILKRGFKDGGKKLLYTSVDRIDTFYTEIHMKDLR